MTIVSIGLLINAVVSTLVAAAAAALTIFLWRRSQHLDESMQAYKWFWLTTVLVWGPLAVRYTRMSLGDIDSYILWYDYIIQAAVFMSGPSLFYYLGLRVLRSRRWAIGSAWTSFGLALAAIWFTIQPNGIPLLDISVFSADATINRQSFYIFGLEVVVILFLLIYDVTWRLRDWYRRGIKQQIYQAGYSAAVILYLILGSIDESKIITDWPLIVFRMLYAGGFLLVYLAITQYDHSIEQNLIRSSGISANYGNNPT